MISLIISSTTDTCRFTIYLNLIFMETKVEFILIKLTSAKSVYSS